MNGRSNDITTMLSGGDPRSLKGVDAVLEQVLSAPENLTGLFECLIPADQVIADQGAVDPIVRMRAGDALEKICRDHPEWFIPYVECLLSEVSAIRQPSVQWHLAQMLAEIPLDERQASRAIAVMKDNLQSSDDWLVVNHTLEAMAAMVRKRQCDRAELIAALNQQQSSRHKTVVSRVKKLLAQFR